MKLIWMLTDGKQLIANYIPNLHEFDFKYTSDDDDCFGDITVGESMIGFTSPFWFERRWFFEVEINPYRTILSIGLSKYIEKRVFCIITVVFFLLGQNYLSFKIIQTP